jgi:uncharacterized repeat protein (TIGR03803 family)
MRDPAWNKLHTPHVFIPMGSFRPIGGNSMKSHIVRFAAMATAMAFVTLAPASPVQAGQFKTLLHFDGANGEFPNAPLVLDKAGNLYGTTGTGGTEDYGVVFKIGPNDKEKVLLNFNVTQGAFPKEGLTLDKNGNLYGTALEGTGGSGVVYELEPSGKEDVLYAFQGGNNEGPKVPYSGVLRDNAGNIYGTTETGGQYNRGTVYKLATDGTLTVLYAFTGLADGNEPLGGLIMDKAGNIFGTTAYGGDANCKMDGPGCGVVFKLDPSGTETVLHTFTGSDGAWPPGGGPLLRDSKGNMYGVTSGGGDLKCGYPHLGCGVIFKLDTNANFSVLYTFVGNHTNGKDGTTPCVPLAMDDAGNIFGATASGGSAGWGTIFELDPTNKLTVLHSLNGNSDGANPFAGLIRDKAGNLFGTAYQAFGNYHHDRVGTVFEYTP